MYIIFIYRIVRLPFFCPLFPSPSTTHTHTIRDARNNTRTHWDRFSIHEQRTAHTLSLSPPCTIHNKNTSELKQMCGSRYIYRYSILPAVLNVNLDECSVCVCVVLLVGWNTHFQYTFTHRGKRVNRIAHRMSQTHKLTLTHTSHTSRYTSTCGDTHSPTVSVCSCHWICIVLHHLCSNYNQKKIEKKKKKK